MFSPPLMYIVLGSLRTVFELELQCAMQAATTDSVRDQCLQLDQQARSWQEAMRQLRNQWQRVLDFRRLVVRESKRRMDHMGRVLGRNPPSVSLSESIFLLGVFSPVVVVVARDAAVLLAQHSEHLFLCRTPGRSRSEVSLRATPQQKGISSVCTERWECSMFDFAI